MEQEKRGGKRLILGGGDILTKNSKERRGKLLGKSKKEERGREQGGEGKYAKIRGGGGRKRFVRWKKSDSDGNTLRERTYEEGKRGGRKG